MRKVKLIVHETYQGKRKTEDVFAAETQGTVLCVDIICYAYHISVTL